MLGPQSRLALQENKKDQRGIESGMHQCQLKKGLSGMPGTGNSGIARKLKVRQ